MITLIFNNIVFAQTLKDLKNRALQASKALESQTQVLHFDELSKTSSLTFSDTIGNTIVIKSKFVKSSEKINRTYVHEIKNQNFKEIFHFVDGPYYNDFSVQWQSNLGTYANKDLGEWQIGFATKIKNDDVCMYRIYSDEFMKNMDFSQKEKQQHKTVRRYYINRDTVFYQAAGDLEFFKIMKKDSGEFFMRFSDGNLIDKDGKVLCKYTGQDYYYLTKLYFAYQFYLNEIPLATVTNMMADIKSDEKEKKMQELYMKKVKNCNYCNKQYNGASFNYTGIGRTKNNPCGDTVEEVYTNAFCSRKCAIDHCKSTR